VHQEIAAESYRAQLLELTQAAVELRACPKTLALLKRQEVVQAEEADWEWNIPISFFPSKSFPNLDEPLRIFAGMAQGTRKLSLQKMPKPRRNSWRK